MATPTFNNFDSEKKRVLEDKEDASRKGSIDAPVIELVKYINKQEDYYTTSSCSGRIIVFSENTQTGKEGTLWLLTSHETVSIDNLSILKDRDIPISCYTYYKFEPFVLHVSCRTLEHAQAILRIAVSSGFKNSGISVSKKNKMILSVRSTQTLQSPVAFDGKLIVTEQYLCHLVKISNEKLEDNFQRIERFYKLVREVCIPTEPPPPIKPNCLNNSHSLLKVQEKKKERVDDDTSNHDYLESIDQLFH
ncbi:PREDICTED: tRNA wybutosine-synthesizing protein 3 homolog isoform X2 [Amphimedon queenslandica]|uniref:tRNA wybutosine-synthesizing protein 3 homolog n=1 Tax=Amphimedon queenslandica TaxID=400682 RepID=A0AAN0JL89_AMPQE|nr:PREDICTED: tRNA wybutosine-synthesizing protein 3 homolog isoform X2 [Amphimedon queenslandica]|eukprot:XP_019857782.1 PREDICTED: tRNA wybutosine-synthesizing protein 3 homolog isoform X2 [Amphimedon queenslandica]